MGTPTPTTDVSSDDNLPEEPVNIPNVFIFHDSLCKNINDSLMGRNDVKVNKVWAPTLDEIQDKVSHFEKVHTIVIQALTRDLDNMPVNDFLPKLYETVEKCLLKYGKVIISLVVSRHDKQVIETKVYFANANIKLKYLNYPDILLCNHSNLDDNKYRKWDKLHLTEFGTSRYANNFKYKIAESLGVTIEKRRRYPESRNKYDRQSENLDQRFNGRFNDNDYGHRYDEYRRFDNYNQI